MCKCDKLCCLINIIGSVRTYPIQEIHLTQHNPKTDVRSVIKTTNEKKKKKTIKRVELKSTIQLLHITLARMQESCSGRV